MAIQREFLGWDDPCLHHAALWLKNRYQLGRLWDMTQIIIVVPGKRAGRRLEEVLVSSSQTQGLAPPQIITAGELPEMLYPPRRPIAQSLQALLARVQTLQQAPPTTLQQIVRQPPMPDDLRAWLALAYDLAKLDDELAGQTLPIDQVVTKCQAAFDFDDHDRWQALVQLHHAYEQLLTQHGLQDRNAARLEAIQEKTCTTHHDIILLATSDLNNMTRAMLDQCNDRVTALIHAPPSHTDGFDPWGCLIDDYWEQQQLNLPPDALHIADRPFDQARHTLRAIETNANNRYSADQITVGLGDESLGPTISRTLTLAGAPARLATGKPVTQSRPAMLLAAIAQYTQQQRLDHFAAMLRHPDIEAHLAQSIPNPDDDQEQDPQRSSDIASWLTLLDRYATDYLHARPTKPWLGNPQIQSQLKAIHTRVIALLPDRFDHPQPLSDWSQPIADMLGSVYRHEPLSRYDNNDADLISALEMVGQTLREQAQLDTDNALQPKLTLAQAITFTLTRLAGQNIPPQGGQPAIELLGWLELQLDDAPMLIITGLNEGSVPRSNSADAFLPDQARKALGLEDNKRRYARDLMMLCAITASRPPGQVTLITGRHDANDNPLAPSRLLLACDPAQLAPTIERFYSTDNDDELAHDSATLLEPGRGSGLNIPWPQIDQPITQLSVTAFRDYLACPYRFYLKRIRKLEPLADNAAEMDGPTFGIVAHESLRQFAHSDLAASTEPKAIRQFLNHQADQFITQQFGQHPPATVLVQREQLHRRFDAWAHCQAQLVHEGWRIVPEHTEVKLKIPFEVDGLPFTITGRIDRIDCHPQLGWRILDYKTSDTAKTPEQTHRQGTKDHKRWIDLQLPLYAKIVTEIGIHQPPELGYVQLSKDPSQIGVAIAKWTPDDLDSAFDEAQRIIRAIRQNIFWPPIEPPPFDDGLSAICMDTCIDRNLAIQRTPQRTPQGAEQSGADR